MKKTLIKLLIAVLLLTSAIGMLASCGAEECTVKIMDGTQEVETLTFEKGAAFSVNAAALAKTGYDYVGLYTDAAMTEPFNADVVEGDLTLYAKYTAKSFYIFADPNAGDEPETRVSVSYNGTYTLTEPAADLKPEHRFLGFYYMGELFPLSGTYTYTTSIQVTAKWAAIPYVTVMNGATQIDRFPLPEGGAFTLDAVDSTDANAFLGYTGPAGFTATYNEESGKYDCVYTGNGSIVVNYAWDGIYYITFEADGVVIPAIRIEDGVTEYALPTPSRDGYTFLGYKKGNETIDGLTYTLTGNEAETGVTLTAVWQKADYGQQGSNDYFLENVLGEDWYVFLTKTEGTSFNFPTWQSLEIGNNEDGAVVKTGDTSFTALKPGTFTLTRTAADGSVRTYKCRVETHVTEFTNGASTAGRNEQSFLADKNGVRIESFLDAGLVNFIPDIAVSGNLNGSATALTYGKVPFNATVEVKEGTEWVTVNPNLYEITNGAFTFDATLKGCEVRLVLTPTYALKAEAARQTVTLMLKLNDGTNVYDNDSLYAAYSNVSIKTINVLRNIKASLQRAHVADDTTDANGNYIYPINSWDHSVYVRKLGLGVSDVCVLNGNYYTVDGGDLPVINSENPGGSYSGLSPESNEKDTSGLSYRTVNVQLGIFLYYSPMGVDTAADIPQQLTINDLYITSNNTEADGAVYGDVDGDGDNDSTTTLVGENVLRSSMSFHGIVVRSTKVTTNKVTIQNANDGFLSSSTEGQNNDPTRLYTAIDANLTKMDNIAFSGIYAWGHVGISLTASYVGNCGGAAIHYDDLPLLPSSSEFGGYVSIGEDTVVENYALGTEPWFLAYGMSGAAGTLKQGVPAAIAGVNQLNGALAPLASTLGVPNPMPAITPANMLKDYEGKGSVFNFIIVVSSGGGEVSEWAADPNHGPSVPIMSTKGGTPIALNDAVGILDGVINNYGAYLGDNLALLQGAKAQFTAQGGFYYNTFDGKFITKANTPIGTVTVVAGLFE